MFTRLKKTLPIIFDARMALKSEIPVHMGFTKSSQMRAPTEFITDDMVLQQWKYQNMSKKTNNL